MAMSRIGQKAIISGLDDNILDNRLIGLSFASPGFHFFAPA
jgi:hypothetical protein